MKDLAGGTTVISPVWMLFKSVSVRLYCGLYWCECKCDWWCGVVYVLFNKAFSVTVLCGSVVNMCEWGSCDWWRGSHANCICVGCISIGDTGYHVISCQFFCSCLWLTCCHILTQRLHLNLYARFRPSITNENDIDNLSSKSTAIPESSDSGPTVHKCYNVLEAPLFLANLKLWWILLWHRTNTLAPDCSSLFSTVSHSSSLVASGLVPHVQHSCSLTGPCPSVSRMCASGMMGDWDEGQLFP